MNTTACLVGNSSSGVREGAFIGTPVVNIGTRQNKRLRTSNVIQVDYDVSQIETAIKNQIQHGKYDSSKIYGDGDAGVKIVDILIDCDPSIQKTITY
jgi:UDP-N-acetylglucosamine 2-epimerase